MEQERNITLEDIAKIAKVSVSTVSRALAGSPAVNGATRDRIREIANNGGYDAPPRRSRKPVGAAGPAITVVLAPGIHAAQRPFDAFSLSLIGGIGTAIRDRALNLQISHAVPGDAEGLSRFLDEDQSDALIFFGQSELHPSLNALARTSRRFVVWGAEIEDQLYCSVGSDNVRGGQRATSHLARLGRRRIAFIGGSGTLELRQRYDGYGAALAEAGIELDASLARHCRLDPEGATEAVDDLLDHGIKFDAIVAASDLVAVGAMRALARRGLRVPDDVAIVGYDDIDIAAHTYPTLTTIRQDTIKAGRLLIAKVMGLLNGHPVSSERLTTELIVRESCGA